MRSFFGDSFHEMRDKHYIAIKKKQERKIVLMDTWSYLYCGYANWAYIIINDGFISAIDPTEVIREIFSKADYVSRNIAGEAIDISNQSIETVLENDILETLEKYLE